MQQTLLRGSVYGFSPRRAGQCFHGRSDMHFYSAWAQIELLGYLLIGLTRSHLLKHLRLPCSELVARR